MIIAICDDEELFREELVERLNNYYRSMDLKLCTYESGEDLILHSLDYEFDLIFLDIEMGQINGIDTAKRVHQVTPDVPIIFLTSHTEFAMQGYEVDAYRFLKKPIEQDKLESALQGLTRKMQDTYKITILEDGIEKYIYCKEILYIKAANVYLEIHTLKGRYLVRKKLKEQMQELPTNMFINIHRSYIVNVSFIKSFDKAKVEMENGEMLSVSRGRREALQQAIKRYMRGMGARW